MSPEALTLANRRIGIDIKEAGRVFARSLLQHQSELSVGGGGYSSAMVLSAHQMAGAELERRALDAWAVCRRLLDADESVPTDKTRAEIIALIDETVGSRSADVYPLYEKHRTKMPDSNFPTLAEMRDRAISLATSELDIDFLGRRRKRVPLGDVLRAPRYQASLDHWTKARAHAEGELSDISGALAEGVMAVEALAKCVSPDGGATLGDCIKHLRTRKLIDRGADKILEGIWVLANATSGVRHGGTTVVALAHQDWAVLRPMIEGALVLLLSVDACRDD